MKQKTKFLILIICFTVFILLVFLGYKYLSTKYKDIFENQNVQAQNKAPDFTVYNKKRRGYKIIWLCWKASCNKFLGNMVPILQRGNAIFWRNI